MSFRTIEWRDNKVVMIDQTRLPGEEISTGSPVAAGFDRSTTP